MRYVWRVGGIVLVSLAIAAAAWTPWVWAGTVNTVFSGTVTGRAPNGWIEIPFVERGFLSGTTACVVIVGYRLSFDSNTDSNLKEVSITQGSWQANTGPTYVIDNNGELHGSFRVVLIDDCNSWGLLDFERLFLYLPGAVDESYSATACHPFTCTIDYLVLGETKLPSLGNAEQVRGKWYPNQIVTGETRASSSGGAGLATISGGGYMPNSSVFVALTGFHFAFTGNNDEAIHEMGLHLQNAVQGGWEDRNELLVHSDGTFLGRYYTVFDDNNDDNPYDVVVDYALIGMIDPSSARYKSDVFTQALSGNAGGYGTWGRGGGAADFGGSGFIQVGASAYPLLAGFFFEYELPDDCLWDCAHNMHEFRISPLKSVFGGWEYSSELPINPGGVVQGRYWTAFNDDRDDDPYRLEVQYVLLGY